MFKKIITCLLSLTITCSYAQIKQSKTKTKTEKKAVKPVNDENIPSVTTEKEDIKANEAAKTSETVKKEQPIESKTENENTPSDMAVVPTDSFRLIKGGTTYYPKQLKTTLNSIIADGKSYDLSNVKFYTNNKTHFERFREGKNKTMSDFYKREVAGKISFYSRIASWQSTSTQTTFVANARSPYGSSPSTTSSTKTKSKEILLFQVGDNQPQELSYSKLKEHIKSNDKSMDLVNKARRNNILQWGLGITGALVATYGYFQSQPKINEQGQLIENNSKQLFGWSPFVFVGVGISGSSLLIKRPKKVYKEAISEFNKN